MDILPTHTLLSQTWAAAEGEDWPEIEQIIPQVGAAFTDLKRFIQDIN